MEINIPINIQKWDFVVWLMFFIWTTLKNKELVMSYKTDTQVRFYQQVMRNLISFFKRRSVSFMNRRCRVNELSSKCENFYFVLFLCVCVCQSSYGKKIAISKWYRVHYDMEHLLEVLNRKLTFILCQISVFVLGPLPPVIRHFSWIEIIFFLVIIKIILIMITLNGRVKRFLRSRNCPAFTLLFFFWKTWPWHFRRLEFPLIRLRMKRYRKYVVIWASLYVLQNL